MTATDNLQRLAHKYANHWPIFPVIGKEPYGALAPNSFKSATTDGPTIDTWFANGSPPTGIAFEPATAGLLVVDVDPRNGGDESLAQLEQRLGKLPDTATVITPGPGEHRYFRLPEGVVIQSRNNAFGDPGIDVKSSGGYVLLAGSRHPNGGTYVNDAGGAKPVAAPEAWVAALLEAQRHAARAPITGVDNDERIPNGNRRDTLLRYAGRLRHNGTGAAAIEDALMAINRRQCEPPLPEDEVRALALDVTERYDPAAPLTPPQTDRNVTLMRKPPWIVESAADIAAEGLEPIEFDIETLLTKNDGPVLLFSPPGSLKSFLALHAARCAATGEDFLGKFAVRKRPYAIYVNFDAGARAFRRRAAMVAPNVKQLYVTSPDGYDAGALRDTIQKYPNAFVVIDCLSDCYQSQRGEEQAETMRRFMRELRGLYQNHGCNGIIVDHPRRAREGEAHGDYYGSVQKEAAARMMWQAQRLQSSATNIVQVKIICKKMSEAEPFEPFIAKVTFSAEHIDFAYDGRVDEVTGTRVEPTPDRALLERVLVGVAGGMSRNVLQVRLGWGADRVRGAIKNSTGVVTIGSGKNTRYGLLSEQHDSLIAPNEPTDEPKMRSSDSSVSVGPPKGALRKPTNQTDEFEGADSLVAPDERTDEPEMGDKSGDVDADWDA